MKGWQEAKHTQLRRAESSTEQCFNSLQPPRDTYVVPSGSSRSLTARRSASLSQRSGSVEQRLKGSGRHKIAANQNVAQAVVREMYGSGEEREGPKLCHNT